MKHAEQFERLCYNEYSGLVFTMYRNYKEVKSDGIHQSIGAKLLPPVRSESSFSPSVKRKWLCLRHSTTEAFTEKMWVQDFC